MAGRSMENTGRLRRALGMGLGTGLASAVPLWRIPRAPLVWWTGTLVAALTAGGVALAWDQADREAAVQGETRPESSPVKRVGIPVVVGVLAGGAAAGAVWFSAVSDRWAEAFVARLGASRPRATYAVAAGVLMAVLEYADAPQQEPSRLPSRPESTPAGDTA